MPTPGGAAFRLRGTSVPPSFGLLRTLASASHFLAVVIAQRRLPHRYEVGVPIFITFCLKDSMPRGRSFRRGALPGAAFLAMDRLLDAGRTGPTYMRAVDVAEAVTAAIHSAATVDSRLHAWVVMPNHVQLL